VADHNEQSLLIENMPEAFAYHRMLFDSIGNPVDYICIAANTAFEKMTGLTQAQVVGKKATEVYPSLEKSDFDWIGTYGQVTLTGKTIRFERYFDINNRWYEVTAYKDQPDHFVTIFRDTTEKKLAQRALNRISWMLDAGKVKSAAEVYKNASQPYGRLSELNRLGLISESIDETVLTDLVIDYLAALETSSAIYEINGDYAFGIFSSGWCKLLDSASRALCQTDDNQAALKSGKWLCHESCWTNASKIAIETEQPVDVACSGGLRLYAIPIMANQRVVGAINFGYGDPPQDAETLELVAEKYVLPVSELNKEAKAYESRPPFIVELAKERLQSSARLIGALVESKLAEKKLQESEKRFLDLFERAPLGYQSLDEDGRFLDVNEKWLETLGYERNEVLGAWFGDFLAPEYVDAFRDRFPHFKARGKIQTEFEMIKKNGQRLTIAFDGRIGYKNNGRFEKTHCIIQDVTASKKAEIEVKDHVEELTAIYENAPFIMVIIDQYRKVRKINSYGSKFTGQNIEDMVGKRGGEALGCLNALDNPQGCGFGPHCQECTIRRTIIDTLESGCAHHQVETSLPFAVKGDRKELYLLISTARLSLRNEPMVLISIQDITERKQAEMALIKLHAELEERVKERTAKLEIINNELDAFTYSVSHDLRSPLRRVQGFSQALLEECTDSLDEQGKDYLARINLSAITMNSLIEDLLKLSRVTRQDLEHEPVELSAVVRVHLNQMRDKEPDRHVETRITPDQVVIGDTALLHIALENLLDNAWKYSAGSKEALIEFGVTDLGGRKVYYIRDNGAGFDMKYAAKLFIPFQRLHSEKDYPGTGVGLSIVSRVIGRHGGEIWAEGEVGKGATFFFTLPLSP
jgi:PAS domain S-box-containing protein